MATNEKVESEVEEVVEKEEYQRGNQDDGDEPVIHAGTYSEKEWQKLGAKGQNKVRALLGEQLACKSCE